eukprot:3236624-Amphidinium_carterae.2
MIPIALGGVCGTLGLLLIEGDTPLLLHVGLQRQLGMILDVPRSRVLWTKLGTVDQVFTEPSGHLTVDILSYPKGGWRPPHQKTTSLSVRVWSSPSTRAS